MPLIFSTTNGTRGDPHRCLELRAGRFFLGSLLNLDAVAAAARESGEDVVIVCAGFSGSFASTTRTALGGSSSCSSATGTTPGGAGTLIARPFADPYGA